MKCQKSFSECYQENTAAAQKEQMPELDVARTKSLHLSALTAADLKML